MGITVGGVYGEIRLGRQVVARLSSWSKEGPRVQFAIEPGSINDYWANFGPPTEIALATPGKFRIYTIAEGNFRDGQLRVKVDDAGQPLAPRVETR